MENTPPPAAAWELARSTSSGLKRTISKCSMDDALYESGGGKKLAGAFDDSEPVLLPRGASSDHHHHHHHHRYHHNGELESSPPLFGWNDSPAAMKSRYYDSLLDTTAMASPSPHHLLYASTDSASTVSLGSPPVTECEYISPATLHAVLLDYLGEVFTYYSRAKGYTFMQLAQSLRTAQSSFRYIQGTVKMRLGTSCVALSAYRASE